MDTENEEPVSKMKTGSMTKELQKVKEREESVATFWQKENTESFEDL